MATVAPPKPARTNGFRRKTGYKAKNPEADQLNDFLREQLFDLKDRLGWTWKDIAKKLNMRNWRYAEVMANTGGFRFLVRLARVLGVRVVVDIK